METTMDTTYILALDQGTTSSRSILFRHDGTIASVAQKEFRQIFPKPGWVEHDPREIWSSQAATIAQATTAVDIDPATIAAIGILTSIQRHSPEERTNYWPRRRHNDSKLS